jgi:hypothetical protein
MAAKFYDPLYSRDGGPPRAYECLMPSDSGSKAPIHRTGHEPPCGHILRTADGMMRHLALSHALSIQITLDEQIKRERGKADGG